MLKYFVDRGNSMTSGNEKANDVNSAVQNQESETWDAEPSVKRNRQLSCIWYLLISDLARVICE